jgi:hypothetical protein
VVTGREWGGLIRDTSGGVVGDSAIGATYSRSFITATPGGFPLVITVSATPALVDPGEGLGNPHARRDVLEVTEHHAYLMGADVADGDPFDSEYGYAWPIAYWPASSRRRDGEPTVRAMSAAARAHVEHLPLAWLESLPAPPPGTLLDGKPIG